MKPHPRDDAARRLARAGRIRAILDEARVRQMLGQAAVYECRDGQHVVAWQGRRFRGPTLDAAILAAETAGGAERQPH